MKRSGYTLVELVAALAIVCTVMAVAASAFVSLFAGESAAASAERLRRFAAECRLQAVCSGRAAELRYSAAERQIQCGDRRWQLPDGVELRLGDSTEKEDRTVMSFFADGSAAAGRFSLTSVGNETTVTVSPLTGAIRCTEAADAP